MVVTIFTLGTESWAFLIFLLSFLQDRPFYKWSMTIIFLIMIKTRVSYINTIFYSKWCRAFMTWCVSSILWRCIILSRGDQRLDTRNYVLEHTHDTFSWNSSVSPLPFSDGRSREARSSHFYYNKNYNFCFFVASLRNGQLLSVKADF